MASMQNVTVKVNLESEKPAAERRIKLQSLLRQWVACSIELPAIEKELKELFNPKAILSSGLINGSVWANPLNWSNVANVTTMPKGEPMNLNRRSFFGLLAGLCGCRSAPRKWRYAKSITLLNGEYNVKDPRCWIVPETERTPQKLAMMCLNAIGVKNCNVSAMPNDSRPPINWIYANPREELAKLLDWYGCRMVADGQSWRIEDTRYDNIENVSIPHYELSSRRDRQIYELIDSRIIKRIV